MKRFLSIALLLMFSVCLLCGLTVSASALDFDEPEMTLVIIDADGTEIYCKSKSCNPERQDLNIVVLDHGFEWQSEFIPVSNIVSCSVDGVVYYPSETIMMSSVLSKDVTVTVVVEQSSGVGAEIDLGWISKLIPSLDDLMYDLGLNSIVKSLFSVVGKIKDFFSSEHSLWKLFENSESMFQGLQNFWSFLGSMTSALPAPIITVIVFVFSTPLIVGFFKMF